MIRILRMLVVMHGLMFFSLVGFADGDSDRLSHEEARQVLAQGKILPLSVILERARREFSAPMIEVEFEREGDQYIYEIVLLDHDGAVTELYFDASTAQLLKIKKEGVSRPGPSLFEEN